jgi:cellobiose phosphorylase
MNPSRMNLWQDGTFSIRNVTDFSYLYFPLFNSFGMLSVISPEFQGDVKASQNHFLTQPVSVEDLRHGLVGRHLFFEVDGVLYSNTGKTPHQKLCPDQVDLEAGLLYHRTIRKNKVHTITTTSFVPTIPKKIELHKIIYLNTTNQPQVVKATALVPIFGRSADNLRDHRHVTSLLNRAKIVPNGILNQPTLSFDERGHLRNSTVYGAYIGSSKHPQVNQYWPVLEDFVGEGFDLFYPLAPRGDAFSPYQVGDTADGYEVSAGFGYQATTLLPGTSLTIVLALEIAPSVQEFVADSEVFATVESFDSLFDQTRAFWTKETSKVDFLLGSDERTGWMKWVGLQPLMRRIYGNSFLPHHDYGRGGRGWRDLWQDLLAQIIGQPSRVREAIVNNVGGIRIDGSNATIIGHKPGEFVADRNKIVRVWSDHGAWGFVTTDMYVHRTGDFDVFFETQTYFKDKFTHYTKQIDSTHREGDKLLLKTRSGAVYRGSVLEHLLIENLVPFYNVGDHGNIRLEDADWNDGLDMAREQGETVAFTALYAGNLRKLANWIRTLEGKKNLTTIRLFKDAHRLIEQASCTDPQARRAVLQAYFTDVAAFDGATEEVLSAELACALDKMAATLERQINQNEWMDETPSNGWYNGYYDNDGKRLDTTGVNAKMTFTGQVFPLMAKLVPNDRILKLMQSVDKHLYHKDHLGVRLNTSLGSDKHNLGRLMGFAFGHKENGALFSHMSVMYAYSLLDNGFAHAGAKVLDEIYAYTSDIDRSKIYPGIPEYISESGRGMYSYLTGSASWVIVTFVEQVFGAKGHYGDLVLAPKLLKEHFTHGKAGVRFVFGGHAANLVYVNEDNLDYGEYIIGDVDIDGHRQTANQPTWLIKQATAKPELNIQIHLRRKAQ